MWFIASNMRHFSPPFEIHSPERLNPEAKRAIIADSGADFLDTTDIVIDLSIDIDLSTSTYDHETK